MRESDFWAGKNAFVQRQKKLLTKIALKNNYGFSNILLFCVKLSHAQLSTGIKKNRRHYFPCLVLPFG
jgi:hypothetical protein